MADFHCPYRTNADGGFGTDSFGKEFQARVGDLAYREGAGFWETLEPGNTNPYAGAEVVIPDETGVGGRIRVSCCSFVGCLVVRLAG